MSNLHEQYISPNTDQSAQMNRSEPEINARELEEGNIAESRAHLAQKPNDGSQHNEVAGGRQDHKDSLNRYVLVGEADRYKDHYLNPDDGKLVLLRVQFAKNHNRDPSLISTWDIPLEPRLLAYVWKAFRQLPRKVLTWTYNDRLREKSVSEGSLPESGTSYDRSGKYTMSPR